MVGFWFADRGKVHIGSTLDDNYVELRVRRWKTRDPELLLRIRNSDVAMKHFAQVRAVFDRDRVGYRLTLTPKAKRPRALEISTDPRDPLSAVATMNLADAAFAATAGVPDQYRLSCRGYLRPDLVDPPVPLFIPYPGSGLLYRLGFQTGRAVGKAIERMRGN